LYPQRPRRCPQRLAIRVFTTQFPQCPASLITSPRRSSQRSDFCVGYFNLRGWKTIDALIDQWLGGEGSQCRLLIGMQRFAQDEPHRLVSQPVISLSGEQSNSSQTVMSFRKRRCRSFLPYVFTETELDFIINYHIKYRLGRDAEEEIKTDTLQLITAFGQACAYKIFSNKVYLVVPNTSTEEDLDRLDSLCLIFGIGLVTFDPTSPASPNFDIVTRAARHEPDLFYTNKYMALIEKELFS
jgi:hypothetical protein